VTVNRAGIGPLVNLGIEDRRRSAEAPLKRYVHIGQEGEEDRALLTERSLESVGRVLADAIPAV